MNKNTVVFFSRSLRRFAVTAAMAAALGLWLCARAGFAEDDRIALAAKKEISPQELVNLVAANRGKVVFVNVFASWCPPCQEETPDLVRFYEQTPRSRVAVLGVSMDESAADAEAFMRKYAVSYPVYLGQESLMEVLGSGAIPQMLVFDAHGKPFKRYVGMVTVKELESALAEASSSPPAKP